MLADIERLIALQKIESERATVTRTIAAIPQRQSELDARANEARAAVQAAKEKHTTLSAERRNAEKEMASAEARLAKFRDQQQNVKTNKEYQAMIHEIDTAKADVDKWSEVVLLRMDDVDAAAASLKTEEASLKTVEAEIAAAKAVVDEERVEAENRLARLDTERASLSGAIADARLLELFNGLIRRFKGAAMAQAVDGLCTECRVRLRPQEFAELKRNDTLKQCPNCQRILFYIAPPPAPVA